MNFKYRIFLILLFFGIGTFGYSEGKIINEKADSLRNEISTKKGTAKISTQLELGVLLLERNTVEAANLAKTALKASKDLKNKNLEMQALHLLGRVNQEMGKNDISIAYYDSSLIIAEKENNNWFKGEILFRKGVIKFNRVDELEALECFNSSIRASRISNNYKTMGSAYSVMGTIFRLNGLYDRAIEYTVNSKLYYEKAGFSEGNAWASYLLGRIYTDLKLPEKALEYFNKGLEIYRKKSSIDGIGTGVAICLEQIGLINIELGKYDEAREFINKTLETYTENKSEYGISNSYKTLGIIEYSIGNYALAEKYLNDALDSKIKIGDKLSLPSIYQYKGLCQIAMGNFQEGINFLNKGLEIAKTNNQKRIQLNIYSKLAEVHFKINDLRTANKYQKEQINIQDKLLSGSANIKIEQLQAIYEIDSQNEQIAELEKQNEINNLTIKQQRITHFIMISGIFVFIIITISIYWFYKKIRLKNIELNETNAAKDKFFAIISHDLRGPINNLSTFLEYLNETFNEHSQTELKEILFSLSKSSENVSSLLENLLIWAQSQLNKIELIPEKLNLTDAIMQAHKGLKQSAENKEIDIIFDLNNTIFIQADANMIQTILRNVISNSIKFTNRNGYVKINTSINTHFANISIEDNGVGISKSELSKIFDLTNNHHTNGTENEKSTGLGLILVKDFVEKNNGTIVIQSEKGVGTKVIFTLPLAKKD